MTTRSRGGRAATSAVVPRVILEEIRVRLDFGPDGVGVAAAALDHVAVEVHPGLEVGLRLPQGEVLAAVGAAE